MMDTIARDIEELKIRFNTAPKLYEKPDFKHLIHTIEHIHSPLQRKESSNAIAKLKKKGKIKFTQDGYAICDKALGQLSEFHTGERIWVNSTSILDGREICNFSSNENEYWKMDFQTIVDGTDYTNHIILITPDKRIKDYGKYLKVFTYRNNTYYIDGKRQDKIIEKTLSKPTSHASVSTIDNPYAELQAVFHREGFIGNTKDENSSEYILHGVRFYIRKSMRCKKVQRARFGLKGNGASHIRMKYYRFGYKRNLPKNKEDIRYGCHWKQTQSDFDKWGYRYLSDTLFKWIANAHKHVGNTDWNCRMGNRDPQASTLDMIVTKRIKNNIIYRYKFQVYHLNGVLRLR